MNLISKNTLENIYERHILDSAQLFDLIPLNTKILVDVGSGAGFPGLILGILNRNFFMKKLLSLLKNVSPPVSSNNYTAAY